MNSIQRTVVARREGGKRYWEEIGDFAGGVQKGVHLRIMWHEFAGEQGPGARMELGELKVVGGDAGAWRKCCKRSSCSSQREQAVLFLVY